MTSISTFLDGRASTQLRGLAWLALSDSGRIVSMAGTDDGGGGITQTWTAGSYFPCRINPVGSRGGVVAEQLDERTTHVITIPAGTAVVPSARFEIANRGTYEITAVRTRTKETIRELEAVEA
jgi:hypothetical protein